MGVPLFLPLLLQAALGNNAAPADLPTYAELASALIAKREYSSALAFIEKGLQDAPADPSLLLRKGIVQYAQGAAELSLRTLKSVPLSAEAMFYTGLDYRALGEHASAQKYLSQAWDLGFHDAYGLYSLIEEDRELGDKIAGLQHFKRFLAHYPKSPWLHVLYGNAYSIKNKDEDARKEYEEALRLSPELPSVNFRLGFLIYNRGEYASAAELFRKEIAINPAYSDASLFLGQTLRHLNQDHEAVVWFWRAISLSPPSDLAYRSLVAALTDQGDFAGAAEVLEKAEKDFPSDPSFPAQLSRILTRLNRENQALQERDKFRKLKEAEQDRQQPVKKTP